MNNLNQIPKTGTFGQAVDAMNTDFGLVQTAITQLEVSAFKDVGYFSSASALQSAYPSPTKGMKADVYDSTAEAYVVYVCNTNGTWTNTGNTDDRQVVVDNYPTDNSTNLVQSGGVKQALNKIGFYDISADHSNTSYASLSQALNAVPTAYQKGGMTVMYIDSTSGLYVQYMLQSASWNKTAGNWKKIDVDEFMDSVYDVSARNGGIKFASLDALLSDENLATLIPTQYRRGGMEMRFVLTSDNKYVQYRLMATSFSTNVADWQGVDDEPTAGSENLVKSGGAWDLISDVNKTVSELVGIRKLTNFPIYKKDGVQDVLYIKLIAGNTYIFNVILVNNASDSIWFLLYKTSDTETNLIGNQVIASGHNTWNYSYTPSETFEAVFKVQNAAYYGTFNSMNLSLTFTGSIEQDIKAVKDYADNVAETKASEAAAVPDAKVDGVIDDIYTEVEVGIEVIMTTGEYYNTSLTKTTQNGRQHTQFISVQEGEKYRVTSILGLYELPLISEFDSNNNYISYKGGHGSGVPTETTFEYTVPSGVSSFVVNCNNTSFTPVIIKEGVVELNVYNKDEVYSKTQSDNRYVSKTEVTIEKKYGVKWSVNDYTDLGTRMFDAVGLSATIGIGSTNGSSDFDDIYPWSEMKRCNIKANANGAKVVTFEGESGFALNGSNGDVFVRIPKFYIEKYKKDGYEYRTISAVGTTPHPAFVENGKELDEIFIGAFEGHTVTNNGTTKLHSYGGVLPTSNLIPSDFLVAAKANGDCYSLYDMRSVDALFMLMAVEFGCRNSTVVFGNGISQYSQPNQYMAYKNCILAATNTNTIRTGYWSSAAKAKMPVGSNMLIFKGSQTNIIKWGKVVSFTDGENNAYTDITFSGNPVDVDTTCTIGSSAQDTNWCETCGGPLNWHTGRASIPGVTPVTMKNPMRYRWIENIVGNLWHYLPDVTFNNLQMYVCNNMASYEFFKTTGDYKPIGAFLPQQSQLGDFVDLDNYNYWITTLQDDIFAKGVTFGNAFTQTGVSSQTGYGGFYYLNSGSVIIANGGGFDHEYRCNILTHRGWIEPTTRWYLYGARLIFKNL